MIRIYAYFNINLKILLKDKLTLLWSICFPTILLLLNYKDISRINELIYWWVYMAITAFIYGIGLHGLDVKESGALKTMFSIKKTPVEFFLANLITQVIYCLTTILIFNLLAALLTGISYFMMIPVVIKTIIYIIPIGFFSQNLTLIKGLYYSSINTVITIIIFTCFILLSVDSELNRINPFLVIANVVVAEGEGGIFNYFLFSALGVVVSIPSILNYQVISTERR